MREDRRYVDRATTLKPLLSRMLKVKKKTVKKRAVIDTEWDDMMPTSLKQYSRIMSFINGLLTVELKSSVVLSEFNSAKPMIISSLNERGKVHVQDIQFRVGDTP